MSDAKSYKKRYGLITFACILGISMISGILFASQAPARAAPITKAQQQDGTYAGSESCKDCHDNIHTDWVSTRHAQAYSSPVFQRDWDELDLDQHCLECHTTGFDPTTGEFAEEGVTCEACHGPFQPGHPLTLMPLTPDAELCSTCHKTTTDEWYASIHREQGIQCQACHNPHSQTPMAETVTELCSNCHKGRGDSFTHGTHANAGLECSNCHMYTSPRVEDPIDGIVPTGHIFTVGSEACIGCHQDKVHTRDEILQLSAEVSGQTEINTEDLESQIHEQEATISNLENTANVRLYTGLAQGAIIGLITGGVIAWVVSRRIEYVEIDEEDEEQESEEDE
jgi:predicted CXXCH cytochrome family protein